MPEFIKEFLILFTQFDTDARLLSRINIIAVSFEAASIKYFFKYPHGLAPSLR